MDLGPGVDNTKIARSTFIQHTSTYATGPGTLLRALLSADELVFATLDSALQAYVSVSLG